MFLVLGAMLAIAAGFDNFCGIAFSAPIQYVVLGLVGIIIGFLVLLLTAMPNMMKALSSKIGILALVFGVVLLIWGLASCFVSRVGLEGGFFASSGLAMIFAGLLNMGILK
jgi:hypothetical protein